MSPNACPSHSDSDSDPDSPLQVGLCAPLSERRHCLLVLFLQHKDRSRHDPDHPLLIFRLLLGLLAFALDYQIPHLFDLRLLVFACEVGREGGDGLGGCRRGGEGQEWGEDGLGGGDLRGLEGEVRAGNV